jgi:hypothetical protein
MDLIYLDEVTNEDFEITRFVQFVCSVFKDRTHFDIWWKYFVSNNNTGELEVDCKDWYKSITDNDFVFTKKTKEERCEELYSKMRSLIERCVMFRDKTVLVSIVDSDDVDIFDAGTKLIDFVNKYDNIDNLEDTFETDGNICWVLTR